MVSSATITRPRRSHPAGDEFRFGIEEEYFLASAVDFRPPVETPDGLFCSLVDSEARLERELLQSQIEVATRPHSASRDARAELETLRHATSVACSAYGLRILACGTHPTASWRQAVHSPKERYAQLKEDLQMLASRNMLCGMHVHVELPDPRRRVEIMTRLLPFIPLLLALSTSSPFWESRPTGLKGYRLTAYDELPRTGLPELFTREQDYADYLAAMQCSGAIADASHVWWSIRPSLKYPTLELRATDCCTHRDDAMALASLYRALVCCLYRRPKINQNLDVVERALAVENKWRAQRYGTDASFVSRDGALPLKEVLEATIEMVEQDAERLGCLEDLHHCRSILIEGTSADAQLRIFEQHRGVPHEEAISAVAAWIAEATLA
jgi:glutamate---cysteine ligase / carboxylate-amine ligase